MKKVVLITGCSSGFGLLIAKRLSETCIVYATTRKTSKLTELQKLSSVKHVLLDVTSPEDCNEVMKTVHENEGRLDVLINNAGYVQGGFFEELTAEEILDQFDTNFFGLQSITRSALPLLRKTPHSKIINLSSIAGVTAMPCLGAYNASKHALEGFSESLRFELIPFDVDVLLIQPGTFKTDIFSGNMKVANKMGDKSSDYYFFSSYVLDKLDSLLGRIKADPDKVAKVIFSYVFIKRPPFRTLIGLDAKLRYFLKWFLPFRAYEWIYRRTINKLIKKVS
jgi:NAD(P)-dependent dehydrogenase (short-subunit alcohol dehydrogenase family)